MKRVTILGSTGSIGRSTLEVIDYLKGQFSVFGLTANRNIETLAEQAARFRPSVVVLRDSSLFSGLKKLLPPEIEVLCGEEGLTDVASHTDVELVVNGLVGSVGFFPTLGAIRTKKRVAIANKEVIVGFGEILTREAESSGAEIIPVDSEHSAIHQCLYQRNTGELSRLVITASGGPFCDRASLTDVSPEEALSHPTWEMGRKVTVDSATLMNKGLEVIEAHKLFGVEPNKIEVLIHPQSIVHSLVEFVDGSVIAQLAPPDMRLPIQYALTYPQRFGSLVEPLDLAEIGRLEFRRPDFAKFPCLRLAYFAIEEGGTYPAVLSAADEVAVGSFLREEMSFDDIPRVVEATLEAHQIVSDPGADDIMEADRWAREFAGGFAKVV